MKPIKPKARMPHVIVIPPLAVPVGMQATVSIALSGHDADSGEGRFLIDFVDEGAGHFVAVSTDGTVRLDAAELLAVADWGAKTCAALDGQNAVKP